MKWNMEKVNLRDARYGLIAVRFNTSSLWFTHTDWLIGKPWVANFAPNSPFASTKVVFEKVGEILKATECEMVDLYSNEYALCNENPKIDYHDIVDVVVNKYTRHYYINGIGFKRMKENGAFGEIKEEI